MAICFPFITSAIETFEGILIVIANACDMVILPPMYATWCSYVDKARTLIEYWRILFTDSGITLKGKYSKEGEEGLTQVIKTYHGLMAI
jgi:hypothetical protein